jgi:hypothetical protein
MTTAYTPAPAPDVPYAIWRQGWDAVAKWKAEQATPAPDATTKGLAYSAEKGIHAATDADAIMALVDAAILRAVQVANGQRPCNASESRAALRAAVEQMERENASLRQIAEYRDTINGVLKVWVERAERAEAENERLRALLRDFIDNGYDRERAIAELEGK